MHAIVPSCLSSKHLPFPDQLKKKKKIQVTRKFLEVSVKSSACIQNS